MYRTQRFTTLYKTSNSWHVMLNLSAFATKKTATQSISIIKFAESKLLIKKILPFAGVIIVL